MAEARWQTPNLDTMAAYREVCFPPYTPTKGKDPDALARKVRNDDVAPHLVRYEEFPNCGHGVHNDEPSRALAVMREFILG